jgi:hypothetical protein
MDFPNLSNINALAGVGVAAGIAAIAAFWREARGFLQYLTGLLLLQKTVHGGMATSVAIHIRRDYSRLPSGISDFRGLLTQIDDNTTLSYVPFDMPSPASVWWGRRGVFVVSVSSGTIKLVSVRGISDPRSLVVDALEAFEEQKRANASIGSGNFYVRKCMGHAGESNFNFNRNPGETASSGSVAPAPAGQYHDQDETWSVPNHYCDESFMYPRTRYISNKKQRNPFQGLFYEDDALKLVEDLKQWFTRENWYKEHGIPWRTGVLLHGPGGTGKSSMARAIAETLGVPLYQYYLSTFTDREFVNEWDGMSAPCVVALEDFDNVFHGRDPATEHKSLSFDCVLNQISGIGSLNGVLLIVTTNRLELIDPAMGRLDEHGRPTRPGRIDHVLHLGECSDKVRRQIADYTLDGWADDLKGDLVAGGANTTPAQFQRICIDAALRRLSVVKRSEHRVIEMPRKAAKGERHG